MAVRGSIAIPALVAQIAVATLLWYGAFRRAGMVINDRHRLQAFCLVCRQYRRLLRALEERQLLDNRRGQNRHRLAGVGIW